MKKVVAVHLLNDFSGSPKVLSQVIKILQKKGFDVECYTNNNVGFLSESNIKSNIFFYYRSNNKVITTLLLFLSQLKLAFQLTKYKNKEVIIYINTLLPFGAAIMGKLLGKQVIYHIHETSLRPNVFKQFLRLIVSKTASKIIFVSNNLKDKEQFNYLNQQVVYNALPKSFSEIAESQHYSPTDKNCDFNVYMIASLKVYKGVNEFLVIAQKCLKNNSLKFKLILNAKQNDIDSYFENKKLPENLIIMATQQNLHPHYMNMSLLLNLSLVDQWVETFGLTIIEAMAYGIPVIVPPVGGPVEIVTNNKEGYLISSKNIDEIAEKIIFLSKNHDTLLRLSKNALKRSKYFSEKKFQEGILKVLNS